MRVVVGVPDEACFVKVLEKDHAGGGATGGGDGGEGHGIGFGGFRGDCIGEPCIEERVRGWWERGGKRVACCVVDAEVGDFGHAVGGGGCFGADWAEVRTERGWSVVKSGEEGDG